MRIFAWFQFKVIPWLTGLGLTRRTVTLEVHGRRSGEPRRVSLSITKYNNNRYLVALYGQASWVKNVRAAQGKAVLISGERHSVNLIEIPLEDRAPVLLAYVQKRAFSHSGEDASRLFFGLGPNPSLAEMEAIAGRYPVFLIRPKGAMVIKRRFLSIDV